MLARDVRLGLLGTFRRPIISAYHHRHRPVCIIRAITTLPRTPLFEALSSHDRDSLAVVHAASGASFTYGSLLSHTAAAVDRLSKTVPDRTDISGERIAFLIENSYDYVVNLLAILASNAIALPLAPAFPPGELRYNLNHSQAAVLLTSHEHAKKAADVLSEGLDSAPVLVEASTSRGSQPSPDAQFVLREREGERGGMMLYTSGTTSRPKGVLLPLAALEAQVKSLCTAWQYSKADRLLHVLPLHHIHGAVNAVLAPLYAGATVEFLFPFNTDHVWQRFARPFLPDATKSDKPVTFFTAVPTVYHRLLQSHETLSEATRNAIKIALKPENLRLNISGSAALPVPTKDAWNILSGGNTLLERYGMTEVGMALSCGLSHHDRVDGAVGWPLPSVSARLADPETGKVIPVEHEIDSATGREVTGEIQLKGPTVFDHYWRNPEATRSEFTDDGWFKTGDVAFRRTLPAPTGDGSSGSWATGPLYFIQGRASSDIIKSGGEKVSALEIEREILALPAVSECAVVGLPSETWGQKVAAVVVLTPHGKSAAADRGGKAFGKLHLRRALRDRLVAYKIPQDMVVVEAIPRNAMGKINKKELAATVFGEIVRT